MVQPSLMIRPEPRPGPNEPSSVFINHYNIYNNCQFDNHVTGTQNYQNDPNQNTKKAPPAPEVELKNVTTSKKKKRRNNNGKKREQRGN